MGLTYWLLIILLDGSSHSFSFELDLQEESNVDHQEHQSHALRTDAVWQDLCGVTDEQTGPGHVVEDVVQEDHGHHSVGGLLVSVDSELCRAYGPDDEHDQPTDC